MIAWKDWGSNAFAEARRGQLPVLLLLPSGRAFKQIERAFAGLDELLAQRCVAVCVERCDRPDLYWRYGGDKPLVLLSDDGQVVDRFDLDGETLATALGQRLEKYSPPRASPAPFQKEVWTGAVGAAARPGLDPDRPKAVIAGLLLRSETLPLPAVELLLYAASEQKDAAAAARLKQELDALSGRLTSEGVFRSLEVPALGAHAWACRLFWEGFALTGDESWRAAARALCGFLTRDLFVPQRRAFRHSPAPTAAHYADENALAVLALLRAAAFEPTCRYGQTAADVLAMLQSTLFDPVLGMVHRRQEGGTIVYGLLGDTAWTLLAFTEAFQMTGHKPHREFADGLAKFLFQELWDRDGGAFLDRIAQKDDLGLLRGPRLAQPEENAAAFEGLWRLHHLKGNANYRRWLEWGLARFGDSDPLAASGAVRVQDMLARGRLDLELVGRPGDPDADALLSAVGRHYAPRRIMSFVDPDDQDYILAHKLETPTHPRLYGCIDLRPMASTEDPAKVGDVLASLSPR